MRACAVSYQKLEMCSACAQCVSDVSAAGSATSQATGIGVNPGTKVDRVERTSFRSILYAADATRLGSFDLVVNALGRNSPLSSAVQRRTTLAYGALWVPVPWDVYGRFAANALEVISSTINAASATRGPLRTCSGPLPPQHARAIASVPRAEQRGTPAR
jgi:hypothetical protein